MKNLVLIILGILCITFTLPIIFTRQFQTYETAKTLENSIETNTDINTTEVNEQYNYGKYKTIKLLHHDTLAVEEIDLDNYLLGVVSAEMPASYEIEALKAQAVVARTYTIYVIKNGNKHEAEGADICTDSSCCQAWISKDDRLNKWDETQREEYWNKIEQAVNETKGKIITYNNEVIDAFFHANSGGKTENVSMVWGGADLPYLQSVETSGEDGYTQYSSEAILTKTELEEMIKQDYPEFSINYDEENCIQILEYTEGNRVKTIKIGNLELSGVEVRSMLSLRSANFAVQIEGDNINFNVIGYGHGVGMSQTGADSLAKSGSKYEDIIKHFYTGVEVKNATFEE